MLGIRTISSEDWPDWRAIRLRALADAPGTFSSTLAQWQGSGDSEPRWRQRLESVPFNVVAHEHEEPIGMVSGTNDEDVAELISLWVAPEVRGSGVGDALVEAFLAWASTVRPTSIGLCVMAGNDAAETLYRRHGFVRIEEDCGDQLRMIRPVNM